MAEPVTGNERREKRIQDDIASIVKACEQEPGCPFRGFDVTERNLRFIYTKDDVQRKFQLSLSNDYPSCTYLSCPDQPDYFEQFDLPLRLIFNRLVKDLHGEMEADSTTCTKSLPEAQPDGEVVASASNSELHSQNVVMDTDAEMPSEAPTRLPLPSSGLKVDAEAELSSEEEYYNANEDDSDADYDYDEDYYDQSEGGGDEEIQINHTLVQDMDCIQLIYGEQALSCRVFGAIDFIDVELHISLAFLDPETAKAWKVKRDEPIVIRLHLSLSGYLDASDPKIEVFQPSQKEKFGIGSQLRKILETFVSEHWRDLTNASVIESYTKNPKYRKYLQSASTSKKKLVAQLSNIESTTDPEETMIDDESLARIMDMGFNSEMGRNALIISRGDVEESINLLVSNPERCRSITDSCNNRGRNGVMDFVKGIPKLQNWITRQHSYPKVSKEKAWRTSSLAPILTDAADLNLLPSQTPSGKTAKVVPTLEYGFLVQERHITADTSEYANQDSTSTQIMKYAQQRLPTLNEYCVVCDEPHVFQNGAMLKPTVCARELCVFAFQTLGVMSDAAEDIATGAEVVDLLIAMASVACKSTRKQLIFDPFPNIVNPKSPMELALSEKNKDYIRVERALDTFPELSEMMRLSGSNLKQTMDGRDPLGYPLLQWIISSNRSHIVKLPEDRRIGFMHTPHQFLLMSSPPAIEAIFRSARERHGSLFAFHGSHMENWHRIMRVGLMNASGTKFQTHGAVYGNGVYLSPLASISFGYSGMGHGGSRDVQPSDRKGTAYNTKSRFLKSKNLTCIALCEVINDPSTLKQHQTIWVMTNPEYVCTRFFFMYEDGQVGESFINTQQPKYCAEIMKAIGYQTGFTDNADTER